MDSANAIMKQFLEQFPFLTPGEIEAFTTLFTPRTLKKGDFFVREGQQSTEVAFVVSGIFRSYYVTEKGDEFTYCFRFPNELVAAYSSLITGEGSVESMQAITPAAILVVDKETLDRLTEEHPKWMKFAKIIAEQQYLELETRVFQLQRDSASKRYQALLEHQPEYFRHIPVNQLASYLGITSRHLSRIRNN